MTDPPQWYAALAPILPNGFEHVAILNSHETSVTFEAFDPTSSKSLVFNVSRSAAPPDPAGSMTLAQAKSEPWSDSGVDHNISLPDGRQIGLYCWFRPMEPDAPGCPDVNGRRTDPETLRTFALALASDLEPDDLPAPTDELDHVPVDQIRVAIGTIEAGQDDADVEAPHYGFSFVQHGNPEEPDLLTVRTVTGFYPPLPTDLPRSSASVGVYRLTWQAMADNSIWYVYDSPASGLDVADTILDRAAERQSTPPNPLVVETVVTAYKADLPAIDPAVTPSLICRSISSKGSCDAVAGAYLQSYRTTAGQIDVYTEYGPDASDGWQTLTDTATQIERNGHIVLADPSNTELAGLAITPELRVLVVGESGSDTAAIAAELTATRTVVTIPIDDGVIALP